MPAISRNIGDPASNTESAGLNESFASTASQSGPRNARRTFFARWALCDFHDCHDWTAEKEESLRRDSFSFLPSICAARRGGPGHP